MSIQDPSSADHATADDAEGRAPAPFWPAFALMATAGAAWWWWGQWSRSFAPHMPGVQPAPPPPAPEPAPVEPASVQPAPVEPAPEITAAVAVDSVMAHAPPTADLGAEPIDRTDAELVEPAPELMAHAPPETVGATIEADGEVGPAQATQPLDPPMAHVAVVASEPTEPPPSAAPDFTPQLGEVSAVALMAAEPVLSAPAEEALTEALGVQGESAADGAAAKPRARRKPTPPADA